MDMSDISSTNNNLCVYVIVYFFKSFDPQLFTEHYRYQFLTWHNYNGHNGLTKSNKTNRSFCCKSQSCNSLSFYSFIRNHLVDRSAGAEQYFARDLLIFD